jgi:hypothetical protein
MNDQNDLIKDIREHLDQSAEALDPEILTKIRGARYNALEEKRPGPVGWALPMGGIAVAVIALFFAVNLFKGLDNNSTSQLAKKITKISEHKSVKDNIPPAKNVDIDIEPGQIEFVEILSSDQPLDFFENLEFYAWLAENEDITG